MCRPITKLEFAGVKYILRTEIMFRRVKSVLDPSPAFLAASEELKQIAAAYAASCNAAEKGTGIQSPN